MCQRPEEDLARLGRLLEAGGDVDRIARREGLALRGIAGDDLASVDAGADGDREPALALEVLIERREPLTHLSGGADCSQGVVLVHDGNAEDGHDSVADELLDRSAVLFQHGSHLFEVALHDSAHRLRVGLLPERRRARNVCEDDGYCLAGLHHAPSV